MYKWKHRDNVHDRSHTPHRLQTTLNPAQEAVAVALRMTLLVSLDDLLAVVREFPQSGKVTLGAGPLLAPSWCGQSAQSQGQTIDAKAQRLQGL